MDSCFEKISRNKVIDFSTKNRLKEENFDEEILIDEVCESLEKD
ncbi:MAG: hypothetical protein ACOC1X_04665 [Promethearchaeota archaeon]